MIFLLKFLYDILYHSVHPITVALSLYIACCPNWLKAPEITQCKKTEYILWSHLLSETHSSAVEPVKFGTCWIFYNIQIFSIQHS